MSDSEFRKLYNESPDILAKKLTDLASVVPGIFMHNIQHIYSGQSSLTAEEIASNLNSLPHYAVSILPDVVDGMVGAHVNNTEIGVEIVQYDLPLHQIVGIAEEKFNDQDLLEYAGRTQMSIRQSAFHILSELTTHGVSMQVAELIGYETPTVREVVDHVYLPAIRVAAALE